MTWMKHTQNTSAGPAPRQRKVAMVRARASSQARTPPDTPMPPTSSEVRPTSVMNRLVWSMNRATPGAASRASRMRQPVSGNAARSAAMVAGTSAPFASSARKWCSTIEPGCSSPVAGSVARPISTRGPKIEGLATRSGSAVMVPRSTRVALPSRAASPTAACSRDSTSGSTSAPPASAAASGCAGSTVGWPSIGQAASTAFNSTSNRWPDAATSIERIVTTSDTRAPRWRSQACSAAGSGWAPPSISMSPPRMRWPSRARLRSMPVRRVPTAAMAATPSARQASTSRSPRTPPRSSRRARRKASLTRSARRRYARCGRSGRPAPGRG